MCVARTHHQLRELGVQLLLLRHGLRGGERVQAQRARLVHHAVRDLRGLGAGQAPAPAARQAARHARRSSAARHLRLEAAPRGTETLAHGAAPRLGSCCCGGRRGSGALRHAHAQPWATARPRLQQDDKNTRSHTHPQQLNTSIDKTWLKTQIKL